MHFSGFFLTKQMEVLSSRLLPLRLALRKPLGHSSDAGVPCVPPCTLQCCLGGWRWPVGSWEAAACHPARRSPCPQPTSSGVGCSKWKRCQPAPHSLAPLLRLLDKVQRSFAPESFSLPSTCHPAPHPQEGGCWLRGDLPLWGCQ